MNTLLHDIDTSYKAVMVFHTTLLTATGIADAVGKQFLTQTKSHSPPFKVRSFPPSYKNMK